MTPQTHSVGMFSADGSGASAGDYFELLKPRVMSLVIFTAIVGLLMAPGSIHPVIAFTAVLCIAIGAGAAGCLNMWYEAETDARMARTARRPIPSGRVERSKALGFGLTLSVASVVLMELAVNWVAAALLLLTIVFYVLVYTVWLKYRTPQNIVIGGAAGAFPPMIGWAAVTGDVSLESVLLFAIIFFWTPPHFWALSLYVSDDYKKAGIPMLPVVAGERETRKQILLYTLIMAPLGVAPWFVGLSGVLYGVVTSLLGLGFVWRAVQVWREQEGYVAARKMFKYSLLYLMVLFLVMLIDKLVTGLL